MFRYRRKYIGVDGTTVADECSTVDRKNIDIEGVC